jgi:hypothetical protein
LIILAELARGTTPHVGFVPPRAALGMTGTPKYLSSYRFDSFSDALPRRAMPRAKKEAVLVLSKAKLSSKGKYQSGEGRATAPRRR